MSAVFSLLAFLLALPLDAQAQATITGKVISPPCGSASLTIGSTQYIPITPTGNVCGDVSGGSAPAAASYQLLTNASATGPAVAVNGGSYLFSISGTFGGASVALNQTVGGVTTTFGTYTSAQNGICVSVGQGTTVQAVVTGGSPSGLNAYLNGTNCTGVVNPSATATSNPVTSVRATCAVTVAALPSQSYPSGFVVLALTTNTGTDYIGGSAETTSTGYPLIAGQPISYNANNSNLASLICTNNTDQVSITGN